MRPAHLLLAVAGVAAVGLGGAGLAAGITHLRIDHVERQLAAQFAELHASGVLDEPPAEEPDALRDARAELALLLEEVDTNEAFGSPGWIDSHAPEELTRELERRAAWYAAIDALPDALWSAANEPRAAEGVEVSPEAYERRVSDSLRGLRSATNHLCAMAWHVAQDPTRAAEAGHWLARAAALARVTDSGSRMDLVLRVTMEQIALDAARRTAALEGIDRDVLLRGVHAELGRDVDPERLARVVHSDLRWLEHHFEVYRARPSGSERLHEQRLVLERVRAWRALLRTDLDARLPELAARLEDRALSDRLRLDHMVFSTWQQRGERVADFLAGT